MAVLTANNVTDGGMNIASRAWVNFNGTTAPGSIRADYNVNSVTRNATGDYTVNISPSVGDGNLAYSVSCGNQDGANYWASGALQAPTATTLRFGTGTGSRINMASCCAIIFR